MNKLLNVFVAAAVSVFAAAPAMAHAERIFYLVGTRHVYMIGKDMYAHVDEREKIEQDYADEVAADNDTYQKALADGSDQQKETDDLNSALDDLANERDQELGALYANADNERDSHPELQIDGDGPYQVVGIDMHKDQDKEVVDSFLVVAPWPGYVVVGTPYGWSFGVVYSPFSFVSVYMGWHAGFVEQGCPAFVGFCGHHGPVFIGGISRLGHGAIVRGGGFNRTARGFTGNRYLRGRGSLGSRPSPASRYGGRPGETSRYGTHLGSPRIPDSPRGFGTPRDPGASREFGGRRETPGGSSIPHGQGSRYISNLRGSSFGNRNPGNRHDDGSRPTYGRPTSNARNSGPRGGPRMNPANDSRRAGNKPNTDRAPKDTNRTRPNPGNSGRSSGTGRGQTPPPPRNTGGRSTGNPVRSNVTPPRIPTGSGGSFLPKKGGKGLF